MTTSRISDTAQRTQGTSLSRGIQKLQEQGMVQLSTGQKALRYHEPDIVNNLRDIFTNQLKVIQKQSDEGTGKHIRGRLELMATSADDMIRMQTSLRAQATRAIDASKGDEGFGKFCENQIKILEKILNTRDTEGRVLFGGLETEKSPIDFSLYPTPGL